MNIRERVYTLKGTMDASEVVLPLIVDDGVFTSGFIVESFRIWNQGATVGGINTNAVLSTTEDVIADMNVQGNVFAWASTINGTDNNFTEWHILDPNHTFTQDLYLHNVGATGFNYLIIMRQIRLTPDEGVLQLVKNQSQA